ncbi:MAG: hypothetical protein IJT03_04660, partial [Clostridia bacterium]|nr:hypothetical protein [Clostridia bacterium]
TNKTTSTVTTDADGMVVLTVEDLKHGEYDGVYTFNLNGNEINLYDGRERHVKTAQCAEVSEGQPSEIEITTDGEVNKIQLVGADGGTKTVSAYTENEDGTRLWTVEQTRSAGEYEYGIKAKVGSAWIDEGVKVTVTVSAAEPENGKVITAELKDGILTARVEGRAAKIQIVGADGGTQTYTRYNDKIEAVKSYDHEGNEVSSVSRASAYEVWEIRVNLPAGEYTVKGKFASVWNDDGTYTLTVTAE